MDRALIRRLVNPPTDDGERQNAESEDEARTRVRRACAEIEALERMTWRAKVTRLLADMDLETTIQGQVLPTGGVHNITPEAQAEWWRRYEELKADMSRVYGDGANAAYEDVIFEGDAGLGVSHARVGGLRLLHRCFEMLEYVDDGMLNDWQ